MYWVLTLLSSQGIILALGWGLAVTLWVPVIFLVINLVINFWIPEADSSKYSFLQSKDEGADGEKKKKKPSLIESYIIGIKECIHPTIGTLHLRLSVFSSVVRAHARHPYPMHRRSPLHFGHPAPA
jgi:hypothetical protein